VWSRDRRHTHFGVEKEVRKEKRRKKKEERKKKKEERKKKNSDAIDGVRK
jgi:hypothetical protein